MKFMISGGSGMGENPYFETIYEVGNGTASTPYNGRLLDWRDVSRLLEHVGGPSWLSGPDRLTCREVTNK
jgi:hypothetical protein